MTPAAGFSPGSPAAPAGPAAGRLRHRPLSVARPEGFAERRDGEVYRAVSPEGLLLRVRTVANDPPKDLAFWSEALRVQLTREGYRPIGQEQKLAGDPGGVFYEWGVRYGNEDHLFLTAILVLGDRLAVAEAGGEHTAYRRHRERILESLETIRLGRHEPGPGEAAAAASCGEGSRSSR